MNREHRTFWGTLLLGAGIIFLLRNYGIIPWHWRALYQAWPFALIFWGLAMLEARETTKRFLFLAAIIALLGLLVFADTYSMPMMGSWGWGGMHGWYW